MQGPSGDSQHRVQRDGDLLIFVADGPILEAHVDATIVVAEAIIQEHARYDLLIDVQKLTRVDPSARRRGATASVNQYLGNIAIFGASLVIRALLTLVIRGMVMMGRSQVMVHFCESEGEARVWLDAQRAQRCASQAKP